MSSPGDARISLKDLRDVLVDDFSWLIAWCSCSECRGDTGSHGLNVSGTMENIEEALYQLASGAPAKGLAQKVFESPQASGEDQEQDHRGSEAPMILLLLACFGTSQDAAPPVPALPEPAPVLEVEKEEPVRIDKEKGIWRFSYEKDEGLEHTTVVATSTPLEGAPIYLSFGCHAEKEPWARIAHLNAIPGSGSTFPIKLNHSNVVQDLQMGISTNRMYLDFPAPQEVPTILKDLAERDRSDTIVIELEAKSWELHSFKLDGASWAVNQYLANCPSG